MTMTVTNDSTIIPPRKKSQTCHCKPQPLIKILCTLLTSENNLLNEHSIKQWLVKCTNTVKGM